MSLLSLLFVLFAVTCEAFVGPAVAQSAVSRSVVSTNSPVMFGAFGKAAPKKAAKKVVKKVVKKAPKKVVKKVAKKVVKKAVKKAAKKTTSATTGGASSTAKKFFTTENWAYQAFDLLRNLPK